MEKCIVCDRKFATVRGLHVHHRKHLRHNPGKTIEQIADCIDWMLHRHIVQAIIPMLESQSGFLKFLGGPRHAC